jgi:hypothetical protein
MTLFFWQHTSQDWKNFLYNLLELSLDIFLCVLMLKIVKQKEIQRKLRIMYNNPRLSDEQRPSDNLDYLEELDMSITEFNQHMVAASIWFNDLDLSETS